MANVLNILMNSVIFDYDDNNNNNNNNKDFY